jgi:WD40 repeat protein
LGPAIYDLAIHTNGRNLAIACRDGGARIVNVAEQDAAALVLTHEQELRALAFSPDGSQLATGCADTLVRFWEWADRRVTGPRLSLGTAVSDLAFTRDGRSLLTARYATENQPGQARFWDLTTRRPLTAPWTHPSTVSSVALSPDGTLAATSCADGNARLWRIPTEEPGTPADIMHRVQVATGMALDESGAARIMEASEWRKYLSGQRSAVSFQLSAPIGYLQADR